MTGLDEALAAAVREQQLGQTLLANGDAAAVREHFVQAVRLHPDYAEAHYGLASAQRAQGRLVEAIVSLTEALRLRPEYIEPRVALGMLFQGCGHLDDAAACFEEVLRRRPHGPEPRTNLGRIYQDQGRLDDAAACFEQVLGAHPDYVAAHYYLATVRLSQGRFDEGWQEFEWRWQTKVQPRQFARPAWDGSPPAGRTLLVNAEEGLGDTLQFVRYIPLLERLGARVILESQPPLVPILQSSLRAKVVAFGSQLPDYDLHAPLLSLPRIFGTQVASIPAETPYFAVDDSLVEHWRQRMSMLTGFRVGIHWQGNPGHRYDSVRSIPLVEFGALAKVPGVTLVSLQQKNGLEQLPFARRQFTIHELGDDVDENRGAFVDTAAVMKNLDLVVSSDTAAAHLAGGLGIPIWVALPRWPDWRWMLDRGGCSWYPTMRLFRQRELPEWSCVFARIAEELSQQIAGRAPRSSLIDPIGQFNMD